MKIYIIFIIIINLGLLSCKGKFVSGQEFFINPYAYKGKVITLRLMLSSKPVFGSRLISAEWDAAVPIRFENIKFYERKLKHKFYLVTFLCKYGSLYHGNYILKMREY